MSSSSADSSVRDRSRVRREAAARSGLPGWLGGRVRVRVRVRGRVRVRVWVRVRVRVWVRERAGASIRARARAQVLGLERGGEG